MLKSCLWLDIGRADVKSRSSCVKLPYWYCPSLITSGLWEPLWSQSCREAFWYLPIPWPLFPLSSQVFGISQRSTLFSATLALQYVCLKLLSGTTSRFWKLKVFQVFPSKSGCVTSLSCCGVNTTHSPQPYHFLHCVGCCFCHLTSNITLIHRVVLPACFSVCFLVCFFLLLIASSS